MPDVPRIHPETRADWRAWLSEHHASATGVWLVSWRKQSGRVALGYDDAVLEALAFGWVDSKPAKLDDDRTQLYFSPRKPRSAWSAPNKDRVERLERAGLMAEAGARAVSAAKADGSWSLLDEVERLSVPADLSSAFDRHPGSRQKWDAFPPSARRGILEWIVQAKRPETRQRRVDETARLAAENERANQWRPKEG